MNLMNFFVLRNEFESLMRNLKFFRKNQKIAFTFLYFTLSIIILLEKRKILISAKMKKDCVKFQGKILLKT